ncbi:MAG: hypothetical protein HPY85_02060 [Anaerolineae bacterium]|nr:hypothetical protein [Anaerolineae bacterium]
MAKKKKGKPSAHDSSGQTPEAALLQRARGFLSTDDFTALLQELDLPLRQAIRLNPLKLLQPQLQSVQSFAQKYGWAVEPIPYCAAGWWVSEAATPIGQTWEHRLGRYYVQDASSMLPVELFDFDPAIPSPLMLDMAASPGGKTTHMIAKTMDRGFVLANDASNDRITALRLVLQTWGSASHAITQFPGEKIGSWFPGTFDYVLLDAPCSMQNLRSTEARPMRSISSQEEASLAQRQKKLLESALHAARVGGQIVYATCTLMPEEDEAVIDWLLTQYQGAVQLVDLQHRLPQPAPALISDESHQFHPDVIHAIRVWPHRMRSSGFFCARFTKISETTPQKKRTPPTFDIHQTAFRPLPDAEIQELCRSYHSEYGVDLAESLENSDLELWCMKNQILAFPGQYFRHFNGVPVRSLGLPVASRVGNRWEPDHQWISRFFLEYAHAAVVCPREVQSAWMSGEDVQLDLPGGEQDNALILKSEAGEFLGIGRRQRNTLKNLLPKRMVL